MLKGITSSLFIGLFLIIDVYTQVIDGEFVTNVTSSTYEVTVAINLQADIGSAGVVQIEFSYNSTALDFPNSPIKNTDYFLHGEFDLYVTQNVTKPSSNTVRISLLTLSTPPPVQIDSSKTLVVTYYFTITDPQATSNLIWTQTDVAPEFLQPFYQVGNWLNLNEPLSKVTTVYMSETLPNEFKLFQNYPNPFNPSTNIKYSVSENGFVKLAVYNLIGEEVNVLVNGQVNAGFYEIEFDATGLPSGIYFYRIQAGSFVQTKKMLLMK